MADLLINPRKQNSCYLKKSQQMRRLHCCIMYLTFCRKFRIWFQFELHMETKKFCTIECIYSWSVVCWHETNCWQVLTVGNFDSLNLQFVIKETFNTLKIHKIGKSLKNFQNLSALLIFLRWSSLLFRIASKFASMRSKLLQILLSNRNKMIWLPFDFIAFKHDF